MVIEITSTKKEYIKNVVQKILKQKITASGIEIMINDVVKTSRPGAMQPYSLLPYFNNRPSVCVATTIEFYINKTKNVRQNKTKLLLRMVLAKCGIDQQFTAHSTRHASTSKAYQNGLNINIIKNAAGWSPQSKVFMKFYNRPIINTERNFAKTVCTNNDNLKLKKKKKKKKNVNFMTLQ